MLNTHSKDSFLCRNLSSSLVGFFVAAHGSLQGVHDAYTRLGQTANPEKTDEDMFFDSFGVLHGCYCVCGGEIDRCLDLRQITAQTGMHSAASTSHPHNTHHITAANLSHMFVICSSALQ